MGAQTASGTLMAVANGNARNGGRSLLFGLSSCALFTAMEHLYVRRKPIDARYRQMRIAPVGRKNRNVLEKNLDRCILSVNLPWPKTRIRNLRKK
jgi:hypothetical protein